MSLFTRPTGFKKQKQKTALAYFLNEEHFVVNSKFNRLILVSYRNVRANLFLRLKMIWQCFQILMFCNLSLLFLSFYGLC